MVIRYRRVVPSWLLACLFLAVSIPAQETSTGEVRGRVLDEQSQPLANATISLRNRANGSVIKTQTQRDGRFLQRGLPPGRYDLTVSRGEDVLWRIPIRLSLSQLRVQLVLDIGKLQEATRAFERFTADLQQRSTEENERRQRGLALRSRHNRGVRLLQQDKPEEAIGVFEEVLQQDPDRAATRAMRASAYAAAGRTEEALSAYQQLVAREPNEASHHNNLAILLVRTGRVDEALTHLERARRLDKSRRATYEFNLGAALFNAGRFDVSVKHFRNALRRDPTMADAHYFYGVCLIQKGLGGKDQKKAVKALRRYLQLEPDGAYAETARTQLQQLGARTTDMLLPDVRNNEELD